MKQPSELLHEHSVHKENIVTPTNVNAKDIEARLVRVNGLVQGVGFRPTVWRIAAALNLRGEVFNDPQGVGVRLEGDPQALDAFRVRCAANARPWPASIRLKFFRRRRSVLRISESLKAKPRVKSQR